jgi:hypothetical protein
MVVTGFADGASQKNLDVYAFRTTDSLVVITLAFAAPVPSLEDETSMQALCPQAVAKPSSQPA